ncbi:MAG: hypothetical protein FWH53_03575 [Leptospirales bacterium]|nr:hypothetical protein [Leptospirales bacterium]
MIKKISFVMVLIMVSAVAVYSNTKLSAQHKYLEKDGKKINCIYCHSGDAKINKKKGQLKDYSLNGIELSEIKSCAGEGCHN